MHLGYVVYFAVSLSQLRPCYRIRSTPLAMTQCVHVRPPSTKPATSARFPGKPKRGSPQESPWIGMRQQRGRRHSDPETRNDRGTRNDNGTRASNLAPTNLGFAQAR